MRLIAAARRIGDHARRGNKIEHRAVAEIAQPGIACRAFYPPERRAEWRAHDRLRRACVRSGVAHADEIGFKRIHRELHQSRARAARLLAQYGHAANDAAQPLAHGILLVSHRGEFVVTAEVFGKAFSIIDSRLAECPVETVAAVERARRRGDAAAHECGDVEPVACSEACLKGRLLCSGIDILTQSARKVRSEPYRVRYFFAIETHQLPRRHR